MDTLAHFLWTFAVYWKHPKRWIAGIIGMMPDLLSFGILMVMSFFNSSLRMHGPPEAHVIPAWVSTSYSITHSLVIFALVALLLWFVAREWFWLIGGWLLHILIDIPTHTAQFFPTPLFWPLSDFHLSGIGWGTWWFMLGNYASLIVVYVWLVWKVPGPAKRQTPSMKKTG